MGTLPTTHPCNAMSHSSFSPFQRARPRRVLEDRLLRGGRGWRGRAQHFPPGGQADMQAMFDDIVFKNLFYIN